MRTKAPLTLEQFLALPDTKPAREYMCGEVFRKPMPDQPHSYLQAYLTARLLSFLSQHPLGRAGPEWRFVFGPRKRALVPDVAFVSYERLPRGDAREHRQLRVAPDLAVEVLSRNQKARPFASKIRFYLRHGVRLVWVIDPDAETIEVYSPEEDSFILRRGDTLDGGAVLPGLSVSVDDIFAQLQV